MGFDLCERGERGECESNSSFYFELFRGGQCITILFGRSTYFSSTSVCSSVSGAVSIGMDKDKDKHINGTPSILETCNLWDI